MATLPGSVYAWMMWDLWKSNSYLWVEGACQLTWKIWFVGLRAAKNVDGGSWRLMITPWSMQRSAWRATSTWLRHPQWPLDNGHTLGQLPWSWETEMHRGRGRREKYCYKEISQKCGQLYAQSAYVHPINYCNSFQLYPESKHRARSIWANDGTSRNMKIFRCSIFNFHHYFVGPGINKQPEPNLNISSAKKGGSCKVISSLWFQFCKVNLEPVEISDT